MKQSKLHCIYIHKNKINNKIYVGQTIQGKTKNRWRNGEGYKKQPFYQAIQKYGWDNFFHLIIEENIPDDLVDKRESFWIEFYHAANPEYGYNIRTSGGAYNEAAKQKRKKYWDQHPERKEQLSQKMKEFNKNRDYSFMKGENHFRYGDHSTGKNASRSIPVKCIETGQIFDSIKQASEWVTGGKTTIKSHISDVCKGKRKSAGKHPIIKTPLHWKYVKEKKCNEY